MGVGSAIPSPWSSLLVNNPDRPVPASLPSGTPPHHWGNSQSTNKWNKPRNVHTLLFLQILRQASCRLGLSGKEEMTWVVVGPLGPSTEQCGAGSGPKEIPGVPPGQSPGCPLKASSSLTLLIGGIFHIPGGTGLWPCHTAAGFGQCPSWPWEGVPTSWGQSEK